MEREEDRDADKLHDRLLKQSEYTHVRRKHFFYWYILNIMKGALQSALLFSLIIYFKVVLARQSYSKVRVLLLKKKL